MESQSPVPGDRTHAYSLETTISTIRSYYHFLATLYLTSSLIEEPPQAGWPDITTERISALGKNDDVLALLRKLPYIRHRAHIIPHQSFINCINRIRSFPSDPSDMDNFAKDCKILSESGSYYNNTPPSVIGLAITSPQSWTFLLDTATDHVVETPEDEGWRAEPAWPVVEFFEVLKEQYRKLEFWPTGDRTVDSVHTEQLPEHEGVQEMAQGIFRGHGWPQELQRFDKSACLDEVKTKLQNEFPDYAEANSKIW